MTKSIEDEIDVWIVNDSKYMTQLLSDLVSNNEIQVTNTARDGAEALRKLDLKKPDVILLDLEMPTMDGLTFIEEVVKQDKLVPIIVDKQITKYSLFLVYQMFFFLKDFLFHDLHCFLKYEGGVLLWHLKQFYQVQS